MSATKGLIFLEPKSAILFEQLHPRIMEGKREPCEIVFADFDDITFKISCEVESLSVVTVNMGVRNIATLKSHGTQDLLNKFFPGAEVAPMEGYQLALQFDCDHLQEPETFLKNISELKRVVFGGPLVRAFDALANKNTSSVQPMVIEYRNSGEAMFVVPAPTKVVVAFLIDFADVTDKAVARVFLQEFVESQRAIRAAPPTIFSKDPLGELAGLKFEHKVDAAGYIAFSLEERHVRGANMETAITALTGFRSYLHYHIKSSKTYLHMRMRKRVAGWMQVLNRAMPDTDAEKKTASGKTFTRK